MLFRSTPLFELPEDFNDIDPRIHPGASDNPGSPNGIDDNQDGIIDGSYAGGLTFAAISNFTIAPGDSIALTLSMSGVNSPEAAHMQAFASNTSFNPATRAVSWTSDLGDANQSFLFSFAAVGGGAGGDVIQRQFTVQVVPEPGAVALLAAGCIFMFAQRRTSSHISKRAKVA